MSALPRCSSGSSANAGISQERHADAVRTGKGCSQVTGFQQERPAAQPLNRARKSAIAYHHCVVLAGTRRIWTATRSAPPMR
jgi:hypothetical protein